jgi:divalent metal cation (Fe/Co/Zn/Cd) transporter
MNALSAKQETSRERTLLVAFLLSVWAPLVTGLAVILSHSTTQLADFIRRTVELGALFMAWWVFRHLRRNTALDIQEKARLEKIAGLSTAAALGGSAIGMLVVTLSRLSSFTPGGNVTPGMIIAGLGLITNTWFWRRYTGFNHERHSPIMDSQRLLYRAKAFVDLCVILALGSVSFFPDWVLTRSIDLLGSMAIVGYLLWSGVHAGRKAMAEE